MTYDNLAREFPKFDQSTLPHIPAGFDDVSWHNDTCPSFLNEGAGLIIFVDFPDADDREEPEAKRFSVGVWDGGSTGESIVDSDDWTDIQAVLLARQFVANLKAEIGDENFAQMRIDNVGIAEGCCASHDFCDANMPMDDAFEKVMGHRLPLGEETPEQAAAFAAGADIWNKAWDIAKRDFLTATDEEVLTAEFDEYLEAEGLPKVEAMELIHGDLTDEQRRWISDFILRWEAMLEAEDGKQVI